VNVPRKNTVCQFSPQSVKGHADDCIIRRHWADSFEVENVVCTLCVRCLHSAVNCITWLVCRRGLIEAIGFDDDIKATYHSATFDAVIDATEKSIIPGKNHRRSSMDADLHSSEKIAHKVINNNFSLRAVFNWDINLTHARGQTSTKRGFGSSCLGPCGLSELCRRRYTTFVWLIDWLIDC